MREATDDRDEVFLVAGTNLFVGGSPYSELAEPGMSTGRRIAREIKLARKAGRLMDVVS